MKLLSVLSLMLMSTLSLAGEPTFLARNQSAVCAPAVLEGNEVVCCDTLPGRTCKQTLDQLLSLKQREFLQKLTQAILNVPERSSLPSMPSCFATSIAVAGFPLKDPFAYDGDRQFRATLQTNYVETFDPEHLQKGDILVFEERGQYFDRDEDDRGHKIFKWVPGSELSHAMYYLGDGLVIQKENSTTAVSSISTLDRSFAVYSAGVASTQGTPTLTYSMKKTKLVLRIYHQNDR